VEVVQPTPETVPMPQEALYFPIKADTQQHFAAQVDAALRDPNFDPETIFVVADQPELDELFKIAGECLPAGYTVRGTIQGSGNVIAAVDGVARITADEKPKLKVKIDPRMIGDAVKDALTKAGFAVGFAVIEGTLSAEDEHGVFITPVGEDGRRGTPRLVGIPGDMVRIALPIPADQLPPLKIEARAVMTAPENVDENGGGKPSDPSKKLV